MRGTRFFRVAQGFAEHAPSIIVELQFVLAVFEYPCGLLYLQALFIKVLAPHLFEGAFGSAEVGLEVAEELLGFVASLSMLAKSTESSIGGNSARPSRAASRAALAPCRSLPSALVRKGPVSPCSPASSIRALARPAARCSAVSRVLLWRSTNVSMLWRAVSTSVVASAAIAANSASTASSSDCRRWLSGAALATSRRQSPASRPRPRNGFPSP